MPLVGAGAGTAIATRPEFLRDLAPGGGGRAARRGWRAAAVRQSRYGSRVCPVRPLTSA
jgi:hypothetical protein